MDPPVALGLTVSQPVPLPRGPAGADAVGPTAAVRQKMMSARSSGGQLRALSALKPVLAAKGGDDEDAAAASAIVLVTGLLTRPDCLAVHNLCASLATAAAEHHRAHLDAELDQAVRDAASAAPSPPAEDVPSAEALPLSSAARPWANMLSRAAEVADSCQLTAADPIVGTALSFLARWCSACVARAFSGPAAVASERSDAREFASAAYALLGAALRVLQLPAVQGASAQWRDSLAALDDAARTVLAAPAADSDTAASSGAGRAAAVHLAVAAACNGEQAARLLTRLCDDPGAWSTRARLALLTCAVGRAEEAALLASIEGGAHPMERALDAALDTLAREVTPPALGLLQAWLNRAAAMPALRLSQPALHRLTETVAAGWLHHGRHVVARMKSLFPPLLAVLEATGGGGSHEVTDLARSMAQAPLWHHGRYLALDALLPHVGALWLIARFPGFVESLVTASQHRAVGARAQGLLVHLLERARAETLSRALHKPVPLTRDIQSGGGASSSSSAPQPQRDATSASKRRARRKARDAAPHLVGLPEAAHRGDPRVLLEACAQWRGLWVPSIAAALRFGSARLHDRALSTVLAHLLRMDSYAAAAAIVAALRCEGEEEEGKEGERRGSDEVVEPAGYPLVHVATQDTPSSSSSSSSSRLLRHADVLDSARALLRWGCALEVTGADAHRLGLHTGAAAAGALSRRARWGMPTSTPAHGALGTVADEESTAAAGDSSSSSGGKDKGGDDDSATALSGRDRRLLAECQLVQAGQRVGMLAPGAMQWVSDPAAAAAAPWWCRDDACPAESPALAGLRRARARTKEAEAGEGEGDRDPLYGPACVHVATERLLEREGTAPQEVGSMLQQLGIAFPLAEADCLPAALATAVARVRASGLPSEFERALAPAKTKQEGEEGVAPSLPPLALHESDLRAALLHTSAHLRTTALEVVTASPKTAELPPAPLLRLLHLALGSLAVTEDNAFRVALAGGVQRVVAVAIGAAEAACAQLTRLLPQGRTVPAHERRLLVAAGLLAWLWRLLFAALRPNAPYASLGTACQAVAEAVVALPQQHLRDTVQSLLHAAPPAAASGVDLDQALAACAAGEEVEEEEAAAAALAAATRAAAQPGSADAGPRRAVLCALAFGREACLGFLRSPAAGHALLSLTQSRWDVARDLGLTLTSTLGAPFGALPPSPQPMRRAAVYALHCLRSARAQDCETGVLLLRALVRRAAGAEAAAAQAWPAGLLLWAEDAAAAAQRSTQPACGGDDGGSESALPPRHASTAGVWARAVDSLVCIVRRRARHAVGARAALYEATETLHGPQAPAPGQAALEAPTVHGALWALRGLLDDAPLSPSGEGEVAVWRALLSAALDATLEAFSFASSVVADARLRGGGGDEEGEGEAGCGDSGETYASAGAVNQRQQLDCRGHSFIAATKGDDTGAATHDEAGHMAQCERATQRMVMSGWLAAREACAVLATLVRRAPLPGPVSGGVSVRAAAAVDASASRASLEAAERAGATTRLRDGGVLPLPDGAGGPDAEAQLEPAGGHWLLSYRQVAGVVHRLLMSLLSLKHFGAVSAAGDVLQQVCTRLLDRGSHGHPLLHRLPAHWLHQLLVDPRFLHQQFMLRRSSGFAVAFSTLLRAHATVRARQVVRAVASHLVDLASARDKLSDEHAPHAADTAPTPRGGSGTGDGESGFTDAAGHAVGAAAQWRPRVHALNILRALVRDSALAAAMGPVAVGALRAAVAGFDADSWAERNSALIVFASAVERVVGTGSAADARAEAAVNASTGAGGGGAGVGSGSDATPTAGRLFSRHPALLERVMVHLRAAADGAASPLGGTAITSLFPALLLLSRLSPTAEPAEASPAGGLAAAEAGPLPPLATLVASPRIAAHPHLMVRSMAAASFAALTPIRSAAAAAAEAIRALPDSPAGLAPAGGPWTHNAVHGVVLRAHRLCAAARVALAQGPGVALSREAARSLAADLAEHTVPALCSRQWLATAAIRAPLVRREMLRAAREVLAAAQGAARGGEDGTLPDAAAQLRPWVDAATAALVESAVAQAWARSGSSDPLASCASPAPGGDGSAALHAPPRPGEASTSSPGPDTGLAAAGVLALGWHAASAMQQGGAEGKGMPPLLRAALYCPDPELRAVASRQLCAAVRRRGGRAGSVVLPPAEAVALVEGEADTHALCSHMELATELLRALEPGSASAPPLGRVWARCEHVMRESRASTLVGRALTLAGTVATLVPASPTAEEDGGEREGAGGTTRGEAWARAAYRASDPSSPVEARLAVAESARDGWSGVPPGAAPSVALMHALHALCEDDSDVVRAAAAAAVAAVSRRWGRGDRPTVPPRAASLVHGWLCEAARQGGVGEWEGALLARAARRCEAAAAVLERMAAWQQRWVGVPASEASGVSGEEEGGVFLEDPDNNYVDEATADQRMAQLLQAHARSAGGRPASAALEAAVERACDAGARVMEGWRALQGQRGERGESPAFARLPPGGPTFLAEVGDALCAALVLGRAAGGHSAAHARKLAACVDGSAHPSVQGACRRAVEGGQ